MLFLLESQARPGVTREQLVAQFSERLNPSTWELIRHGDISNVLYKTGKDVGFYATLNAPTPEEAQALVQATTESQELFDIRVVAVNHFPHFD
jgi:hypothetical protein